MMFMRNIALFLILFTSLSIIACGPSKEEREAREKFVADSLAKVDAAEKAKIAAEEAARKAEEERLAAIEAEKEKRRIEYDANGKYTVQVEAARGQESAEKELALWKKRGYKNAFIVKFGDESTGDVWFRLRLGRFATKKMANKVSILVKEDFNRKSWVTSAE